MSDRLFAAWRVLALAALGASCALAFVVILVLGVGGMTGILVVSDSMAPAVRRGDLVILEHDDPATYRRGDIVTFEEQGRGTLTHRVVQLAPDGAGFVTKGDANRVADSSTVPFDAVRGRVRWLVPSAGRPLLWLSEEGAGLVRAVPAVVAILLGAAGLTAARRGRPEGPACVDAPGGAPS